MALVKWDPFREMEDFQRSVGRIFGQVLPRRWHDDELLSGDWEFPVNVQETENAMLIDAELPGVKQDDIEVQLVGDQLVIRAERKEEKEEKHENYLRREIRQGSFCRSFSLATPIKADAVKATYKDGVLHLELPKAEEVRPKKIKVSAS